MPNLYKYFVVFMIYSFCSTLEQRRCTNSVIPAPLGTPIRATKGLRSFSFPSFLVKDYATHTLHYFHSRIPRISY
jgi:hypothetical protein